MDRYGINRAELDEYGTDRLKICREIGKETFRFALAGIATDLRQSDRKNYPRPQDWEDLGIKASDHADDKIFQGLPYGPHGETIQVMTRSERETARLGVALGLAKHQIGTPDVW